MSKTPPQKRTRRTASKKSPPVARSKKPTKRSREASPSAKAPKRKQTQEENQKENLQVFIGWSGGDKAICGRLADQLHKFLVDVSHHDGVWVSRKKMPAGADWREQIFTVTTTADFGIFCLTPEPHNLRWIHFEAGMIYQAQRYRTQNLSNAKRMPKKPLERIIPLLVIPGVEIDLKHSPLADFQVIKLFSDKNDGSPSQKFSSLVYKICEEAAGVEFDYDDFLCRWEDHWPVFAQEIAKLGQHFFRKSQNADSRPTALEAKESQEQQDKAVANLKQIAQMSVADIVENLKVRQQTNDGPQN